MKDIEEGILPGFKVDVILYKCIKCGKDKPISEYWQMKYNSGKKDSEVKRTCHKCKRIIFRLIRKLKKENLSPSISEKCPSCGETLESLGANGQRVFKSWVLHHDHKTGKFLAWVCQRCNTGIGCFKDSPKKMRKCADWLDTIL